MLAIIADWSVSNEPLGGRLMDCSTISNHFR